MRELKVIASRTDKNSQELFKKRDQTKLLTDVIEDRKGSTWKNGKLKLETMCIWTRQQEGRKEHGRETCTSALKNQWVDFEKLTNGEGREFQGWERVRHQEPSTVENTHKLSTPEAKTGRLKVQGCPQLHRGTLSPKEVKLYGSVDQLRVHRNMQSLLLILKGGEKAGKKLAMTSLQAPQQKLWA